jgi:hypothetical protein
VFIGIECHLTYNSCYAKHSHYSRDGYKKISSKLLDAIVANELCEEVS